MGFLRKLYPGAFKLEKKVVKPFVIKLVVYVVIGLILAVVLGAPAGVIMGIGAVTENEVLSLVGTLIYIVALCICSVYGIYMYGGIVISILKFVGVIKDQSGDVVNNNLNNAAGKVGGAFEKVVNATENVVNKVVDKATEPKEETAENDKTDAE